jgi:hypothetical protein
MMLYKIGRKKQERRLMITLEFLKDLPPFAIFAEGNLLIEHSKQTGSVRMKWVAVRGGIWDWAIYQVRSDYREDYYMWDYERIASNGDKIHNDILIRELVACDEEAFKMYRF